MRTEIFKVITQAHKDNRENLTKATPEMLKFIRRCAEYDFNGTPANDAAELLEKFNLGNL